jgi:D-hexose-6-phosphate mutarotase
MKIEKYEDFATVGDLLDFIEKYKIPREGKILVQRVEDVYFDKSNWKTIDMPGFQHHQIKSQVDKAIDGTYSNKEEYPLMTDELIESLKKINLDEFKDKYIVAWSPVKHDDDNLYLDCHY